MIARPLAFRGVSYTLEEDAQTYGTRRLAWIHPETGNLNRPLPRACIAECAAPGQPADDAVRHWRGKLGFHVPTERAIRWLRESGAWTEGELRGWNADRLAETCLWLLACEARENRRQPFGLVS